METLSPRPLAAPRSATVVIPCYNYGHYLPGAVRSALDQQGVEVEVIIVDDASPDGSAAVAHELAARDDRVRVIEHEQNKRHILTYNDGLAEATGDLVTLVSADDLIARDALTRAAALMDSRPGVGLVYGEVQVFEDDEPDLTSPPPRRWVVWEGREWARAVFGSGINVIKSPEAIVRRSVMEEVGLYDPAHPHAGDLQMWLRIAAVSDVGYLAGSTQAFYRQHASNMHSVVFATDQAQGMITDLRHRLDAFTTAAESFDDGDELLQRIRRAEAREAIDLAARAYVWGLTESWPVDELIAFARECDPQVDETPAGRAFHRRRRLGRRLSRKNPLFVVRERLLERQVRADERRIRESGLPT